MAIRKRPITPRQKMINLLYIILMAMLALNISSEVLEGFSIVEESLLRTTASSSQENQMVYERLAQQMQANPEKVRFWYEQATQVRQMSDSLYDFAQHLKEQIVRAADGPAGDVAHIENKDDLEAASEVMLAPLTGKGQQLFQAVTSYRTRMLQWVTDSVQHRVIAENLATKVPAAARTLGKNWQEYMFENMPVAAAVTMLTKLQSDIRYAEGEVLHALENNVDVKDVRVNRLEAFVVPESRTVMSGDPFTARILMAAVDTTQHPEVYVGGRRIAGDTYRFTAGGVGSHSFAGYIQMKNGQGDIIRRNFTQSYSVVAPSATVSADLMNVLYAGYDNPISISIPGASLSEVEATMRGGSFRQVGMGKYIARPAEIGKDVTIQVTSRREGRVRQVGSFTFHVRKLPDPMAYLTIGDNRFRGGGLSKAQLMSVGQVHAAIDDGLLDIPFKVVGFETVFFDNMGNAVPVASQGAAFSERQRDVMRKLSRNRRFYIRAVKAIGPDGITRTLNYPMEVILK